MQFLLRFLRCREKASIWKRKEWLLDGMNNNYAMEPSENEGCEIRDSMATNLNLNTRTCTIGEKRGKAEIRDSMASAKVSEEKRREERNLPGLQTEMLSVGEPPTTMLSARGPPTTNLRKQNANQRMDRREEKRREGRTWAWTKKTPPPRVMMGESRDWGFEISELWFEKQETDAWEGRARWVSPERAEIRDLVFWNFGWEGKKTREGESELSEGEIEN